MRERDNGGPAYPALGGPQTLTTGMSLRDWLAGQALVGMGTWCPPADYGPVNWDDKDFVAELRADYAYRTADAMIAVRSKGGAA